MFPVKLGKNTFKTPLFLASGTWGLGDTLLTYLKKEELQECVGALITKGISLKPMPGNPPPRLYETSSGLINSIGLENPGIEAFLKIYFPSLKALELPIIINLHGREIREFVALVERLKEVEISGIELNISCPNVAKGGIAFSQSPKEVYELVKRVRKVYEGALIVKLSPVGPVYEVAKASEEAGACAITVANTYPALGIISFEPLQIIKGGLSGPAIKPLTLRLVFELSQRVKIPIIASGGITSGKDIVEYMIVGAKAFQLGTVNLLDPRACVKIYYEAKEILTRINLKEVV
ncbi:MAG: dihydroorotate dehydrogenase [Caldimicrobium sp.]